MRQCLSPIVVLNVAEGTVVDAYEVCLLPCPKILHCGGCDWQWWTLWLTTQ